MEDNFIVELIACLNQLKSLKQLNADIKAIEKVINMLHITGTFAKGNTKKELNSYIKSLQSQLNHVKLTAKLDGKNLKNEVNNALNQVSFKDIDILDIDENKTKLKLRKVIADVKSYVDKTPIPINIESKKSKLNNDLTSYLNKNTKIGESSVLLEEAEKVRQMIDRIDDKRSLREATDAFQLYRSEVSATGYSSKSTTDKIKSMLSKVGKIGSIFGIASMAVNNFTKSLQTLKSNDTILTEISKTSEMAKQQIKELGDEAFKTASKYGQLSSNYLISVQEMARAGYDDNVKAMAELSTKAQGAGDMNAELANKYIIATDKAFKMNGSIEALTTTLDGANNITNNNALSMSELSEAMSIVGSQAASSGLEVNETTAALSTMIAVTQESGSKMANAFKGILMNLQQVTGEVNGEEIDTESLTKYEKACAELGVSLSTVKDGIVSLKEPMQIIKELSEAYTQLDQSDARRANLLSAVGNKYRANALNAILENYDMYEKMLQEYTDGLGSMDVEAEKTANSWSGRLNSLQNSWDSFVNAITNKEVIMNGVSFFDRLIQGAEKLVDTFGAIPVTLTAVNSTMVALNKDYGITQLQNAETGKLDIQGNLFGIDFTAIKEQKKHFAEAAMAISDWNCELANGKVDINVFENAVVKNNAQLKDYLSTCSKNAPASLAGYKASLNAAGISTDALRLKTILLNAAISMGIGVAIQGAVQGISALIQHQEKLRQKTEESANTYKETSSSINDYISRYKELHQALLDAKGNEEETYSIKKQLLDLQTELNDKLGEEYGKLNLVTDAYKDQTEAIKAYNKEAANSFLNDNYKGIEDAQQAMTKKRQYNLGGYYNTDNDKAFEEAKKIAEKYNGKGIDIISDDYDGSLSFRLTADADSAEDTINEFMNDLRSKADELGEEHLFDGILNVSANALENAKSTIEDYGEIYRQALLADIVSDDGKGGKADKFNELTNAVEEYNEALLKSEDPYNDENVAEARENLKALQQELSGEDWEKYGSVIQEVLEEADTKLLDFYNRMKNGPEAGSVFDKVFGELGVDELAEKAEKLRGLTKVDLESMTEDGDNGDVFDEYRKSAESYGLTVEELIDVLIRLGIVQDDINNSTIETPKTLKEQLDKAKESIDNYQSSIKSISDSMADVGSLSSSDIVDLMQANPSFDWEKYGVTGAAGVGELEDALKALTKQQMKEIDSALEAAGASDEMRAAFASMGMEAIANADRMGAATTKLNEISSAYKTVQTALQEYAENGYMSMENVTAMLNLDDAYLAALVNEQGQVTLNADTYQVLAEARLAEAESAAISQAMADISAITSNGEASAKAFLIDRNFALANSNIQLANTYGQVAIMAREALAAEGAGQYTKQSIGGVMNALNAKLAIIKAGRASLSKSFGGGGGTSGGSGGGGGKKSASSSKPSSKEIDWFEYRVKELDEAIELAKAHLDNLTGASSKNQILDTMESIYSTKQHDLKQGLEMYSKMAEKEFAKIPAQFQDAVKNGALGVTDFIGNGNDDLVEAIENYRKLAEKVGDLESQVAELDATIRKLRVDKFKNIAEDYEKLIGVTDDYRDKIQSIIDLEESSGNKVGVAFYDTLVSHTQERKKLLEEEFRTLNKDLQNALSSGKIKLGSDEWQEMRDIIVDVDSEIIKCSSDIEDFINAKLELKIKEFEEIQDALDAINDSLSDYISLLESDTVTNGTTELVFTKEALTQMGLLQQQYELASEKVRLYNDRMQELKKSYSDGLLSETEYREQLMELISAQNEQAVAMKDSKDAILDLIRNGIDEVCDAIDEETYAYQKLIDKKKEALEQDKNEADFQKQVSEKQKKIFAIQRQIAALGNADDLESNARRKQLKSDLVDAQLELDELYADHNYDIQMDALDKEADAYEEAQEEKKDTLQKSLDDEEKIIAKYLKEVINNHTTVYNTLQEMGVKYGIKLENSITEPWRVGQNAMGQYAISLDKQTSIFVTKLQGVENQIYSTQTKANNMASSIINAFGVSSEKLVKQINNVDRALATDKTYAESLGKILSSVLESRYNTSGIISSITSIKNAADSAAGSIRGASGALNGLVGESQGVFDRISDKLHENINNITQELNREINKLNNPTFTSWTQNTKNALKNGLKNGKVPKYAKGGVVKKDKDNPFNSIAESMNEDTMVAVKEGEWIIDKDTVEGLTPLAKALDVIDAPFLTNSISNDSNNLRNMDLLNPLNHYTDVVPNNTRNDINIVNEVNINGNVDSDNVRRIQKQIDASINKALRAMLSGIRY